MLTVLENVGTTRVSTITGIFTIILLFLFKQHTLNNMLQQNVTTSYFPNIRTPVPDTSDMMLYIFIFCIFLVVIPQMLLLMN